MGIPSAGSSGILSDIWRYADAAYNAPKSMPFVTPTGCRKFYRWQDDTDFVFCSVEGNRIVVSSRGSDSKNGNLKAWVSNMRGLDRIHDTVDPGIHDGFGEFGHKWIYDIVDILVDGLAAGKRLIMTGHSRGAAATGARMVFLHDKFKLDVNSVIVFGTPNWCSKEVRNNANCMPTDYTNVNTPYDIASNIPPHPIMYRPGKEYVIRPRPYIPLPMGLVSLVRGIYYHLPSTYRRLVR